MPFEPGNLTAVARDQRGKVVAVTSRSTNVQPASLALSIDAPNHLTGTGSTLLLDGQDAALLRASVIDRAGRVVHLATNNISFRVVSGPGRIQGTHNGDPRCHEPNNVPWHSAYHGLVRAVVRVTSVAGRPAAERALLRSIDIHGVMQSGSDVVEGLTTQTIVVEASSDGFRSVRLSIPVSTDPSHAGVMLAASSSAGKPVYFF